jgi:pyruvate/2-oxoglutarate dehydrogenase complex dihydrolipoamide dehydrogenase (E3) component
MEREFDVVVIGAGPAGEIIAGRVAQRSDKRVAIVERELVGGECSFWACMPSKALLRAPELLSEVARVPGAAEAVTGKLDVEAVLARRDEVIHDLDDSGQLPWLERNGIELFRGQARFEGERRVRVSDDVLVAREAVVLAVGSGALFPPIPGLAEAGAWSNREITTAEEVPGRLLVLGGGVVGVEMAAAWSALGSSVELIEALPQLLSREEPFAAQEVQEALEGRGVKVRTGAKATEVTRQDGTITVALEGGETVAGDRLLVAVGRTPHTRDLGLEQIGLPEGKYLEVDDRMQVNGVPWLYAVGDVNGRSLLTHSGKYQARIAADNLVGDGAVATWDGPGAPRVVFTDPQVAAVGLTLAAARERGINAEAVDLQTSGSAGASFIGRNSAGTTRFVVDADRDILVGVTFVGFEVADFLQAATIAVVGEVPLTTLAHAVAPFPTRSELWLKFLESWEKDRDTTVHGGAGGAVRVS